MVLNIPFFFFLISQLVGADLSQAVCLYKQQLTVLKLNLIAKYGDLLCFVNVQDYIEKLLIYL